MTLRAGLLATASAAALAVATPALAADLVLKAPPPEAWVWTGPYAGVTVGAGLDRTKFYDLGDPTCCQLAFINPQFFTSNRWTPTVGGQIGYNWQSGNVVTGVEADLNWIGRSRSTIPADFFVGAPAFVNSDTSWFATFRARAGLAYSRTLFYATGGLAVANIRNSWGLVGLTPSFSYSDTSLGWAAGGGIEHMLTKNWTVKVEALHADFGTSPTQTISGFAGNYQSKFTNSLTVVRGGLNWKW